MNPRAELAPLSPELVAHLTASLGPPKNHTFARDGGLDLEVIGAWTIGVGRFGDDEKEEPSTRSLRGTRVEILLTVTGRLVTNRIRWREHVGGSSEESSTGEVHGSPSQVLDWLLQDGNGKLGPASKTAWREACRNVPAMNGLEFERVE
jgi:hypothetical protein